MLSVMGSMETTDLDVLLPLQQEFQHVVHHGVHDVTRAEGQEEGHDSHAHADYGAHGVPLRYVSCESSASYFSLVRRLNGCSKGLEGSERMSRVGFFAI